MNIDDKDRFTSDFPVTEVEVDDMARSGIPDSGRILETMEKWGLDGTFNSGIMLWLVKNLDKPRSEWTKCVTIYLLPEDGEQIIKDLATLSLGYNIVLLSDRDFTHSIYVGESKDGTTNIDAEVLDKLLLAFKRK